MLKRIVFVALVALLSAPIVNAQIFTFGPKAGFNFSSFKVDESSLNEAINLADLPDGRQVGIAGGVFFQFNAAFLNLQPEIMFSQNSAELQFGAVTFEDIRRVKFSQIDIPVLAGFNLGRAIRIQAGPVMSYVLDVDMEPGARNLVEAFVEDFDNKSWGYQAGVGLDLGRLQLDARVGGPIAKRSVDFEVDGNLYPVEFRRQTIQLTAAVALIK